MTKDSRESRPARPSGFLGVVERVGNVLPDPFWLFVILGGVVLVLSWIGSVAGLSADDPQSGKTIHIENLLSSDGLSRIVTETVTNYTSFPPLGLIITVMLGVAVAEHSGLISAVVRAMVARVGPRTLTFAVALAGVTGSVASDAVYVILIPLGAMSFRALGRSPIVGAMVAFAASSAGFNASLVLNVTDVLLGGISTSAAQLVDPGYAVSPLANYFFVVVSSFILAGIITAVTELFVDRKAHELVDHDLISYEEVSIANAPGNTAGSGDSAERDKTREDLHADLALDRTEVRGLAATGVAALILAAVYAALLTIPGSPLRGPGGSIMDSPLISDVAVPIAIGFFLLGLVYGAVTGTVRSASDLPEMMARGIRTLLPMLVLFFAISQFLAWFQWSNIGSWLAVRGSELLQSWHLPTVLLFAGFVLLVTVLNLLITSGSAQWALMAPVIVPMMMYLGVSPEATQMLYRIGDSPTNIITPMSPYFALALTFLQRYYRPAGVGTLMSLAIPFSVSMLVGWFIAFVVWWALGIPLGPGSPMSYPG
ncbi:AbgT family transporter [Corynebacterium bovis]|uniref:Aminobenzoyl-glutamate transport protein n=1 Tax=Corynebacterium bovis DSM 20582 = CIP 54.80 TaxID=927655 RepID=A0A8I0CKA6_9CORY|nr:AbgT family transporter [Corynebacterium bovis]MBB3115302.1 aminobenzoyl-glutamate transport protein [Corynebacterium bovis DSM 20582 = CIP 54.80]QQC48196.1 AbgT family transporter [Corynebacterium bovis]RRO82912.1 p-aminobenzoyl-glutamate transporter [Corynebacterium bovis]RRO83940.1 p-aminobenzoyl-glutamate transporter [Corynebacterium bovis]RRO96407.1 p-aminobenzoyl-glutamate transporter [Corynebacterium bovis]